jgi:hypothetical protein
MPFRRVRRLLSRSMSTTATTHRRAPEFEPLALLHIVRQVAESSPSDDPLRPSTRSWDIARELNEHFAAAPAARRICEHLGLSWQKVCELAFMVGHAQRVALGHALGDAEPDWLTDEYCNYALKLIAHRQGVATLTPGEYRTARAKVVAGRSRRNVARQVPIPTAEQITINAGSWDEALARAGLAPRRGLGGQPARGGPVPIVQVVDRCYDHFRTEPTLGELVQFARANRIPFPRKERGRSYSSYVKEWKDWRATRGLDVPDGPPPKSERPDYSCDVGAALPGERRAKSAWGDRDEVVVWVTRYLAELKRRELASQRAYDAWARQQDGAPWASVFERHGGWVAVPRRSLAAARAAGGPYRTSTNAEGWDQLRLAQHVSPGRIRRTQSGDVAWSRSKRKKQM